MGVDPDLAWPDAYETLKQGSEIGSGAAAEVAAATGREVGRPERIISIKELSYDDETAVMYQRGDHKI